MPEYSCAFCPALKPTPYIANWQRHCASRRHIRRAAGMPDRNTGFYCRPCDYTARRSDHMVRHKRSRRHERMLQQRAAPRMRRPAMYLDPTRYV